MSGAPVIASVVEGYGEVSAVPVLVRRIGREIFGVEVTCLTPHRLPRGRMEKESELGRALMLQGARVGTRGGVIILLDADDDDPAELAARLEGIAGSVAARTRVVVAVREYEAWFLAGIQSLRTHRSVSDDAEYEGDPEAKRDCKGALERLMTEPYGEVRHQVAFSSQLDVATTMEHSPSFRRFVSAVGDLINATSTD